MNPEVIEHRIEELESVKSGIVNQIHVLKTEMEQLNGAIKEMWEWHEAASNSGEYGRITFDGEKKVLKLPVFDDDEEMYDALEGKFKAIDGEDEDEALDARAERARRDGQIAIDRMDENAEGIQ